MRMQAFITKWNRDRKVSEVVRVGKKLRKLRASRAGIEVDTYEHLLVDVDYLDSEIFRLERKHADLIHYLKSTA